MCGGDENRDISRLEKNEQINFLPSQTSAPITTQNSVVNQNQNQASSSSSAQVQGPDSKIFVKITGSGKKWSKSYLCLLKKANFDRTGVRVKIGVEDEDKVKDLCKRSSLCRHVFKIENEYQIYILNDIPPRTLKQAIYFLLTGKITIDKDADLDDFMEAIVLLGIEGVRPEKEYGGVVFADEPPKVYDEDFGCYLSFEKKGLSGTFKLVEELSGNEMEGEDGKSGNICYQVIGTKQLVFGCAGIRKMKLKQIRNVDGNNSMRIELKVKCHCGGTTWRMVIQF